MRRYLNICHHKSYKKYFTKKKTVFYCICCWIAGILVDLPCEVGWGNHVYDLKLLFCVWNRLANHGYSIFFPVTVSIYLTKNYWNFNKKYFKTIILPSCMVFYFYMKIFLFVRQSKSRISPNSIIVKNSLIENKQSIKVAKGLFLSFMLFVSCW